MQTRAQASNARQSPPERLDPLVRPNAWRLRDMVQDSTLGMEERIAALEAKDVLTNSHWQSVICISKMLETTGMWNKFKDYNYKIVAAIEMDESAREEHVFRNEHQWKTLEFVNHLGDLHMKPIPPKPWGKNNELIGSWVKKTEFTGSWTSLLVQWELSRGFWKIQKLYMYMTCLN